MSACSDINQSILAQQSTHVLAYSITMDARVWVILYSSHTSQHIYPLTTVHIVKRVKSACGRLLDELRNYNRIKMQNRLVSID